MLSRIFELANITLNYSGKVIGNCLDKTDVVLVTGGCSGLGEQLVIELLRHGYPNIIVFDISIDHKKKYPGVHYYECDVSNHDQILQVQQQINQDVGIVTCVINNAGIMIGKPLVEMTHHEIDKLLHINLNSNFYTNKIFLPGMIELKKGYIITIASVLGYMAPANLTAYGASKSGLIAMHEALTHELHYCAQNIKTLLICPGQLNTRMFEDVKTPSSILAPEIQPTFLAKKIVSFCEVGKRGDYKIPFYGNFLPVFRSLPWPIVKAARIFCGIDQTMNEYSQQRRPY